MKFKHLSLLLLLAIVAPWTLQAQEQNSRDMWDLVTSFTCSTGRQHAVAFDGENIYTQSLSKEGLIIMGNEGNGISEAVRTKVNRKLLIPDFHQGETADSLNVAIATAITCSEFRRRQA